MYTIPVLAKYGMTQIMIHKPIRDGIPRPARHPIFNNTRVSLVGNTFRVIIRLIRPAFEL